MSEAVFFLGLFFLHPARHVLHNTGDSHLKQKESMLENYH
jgi:hypothetical protein